MAEMVPIRNGVRIETEVVPAYVIEGVELARTLKDMSAKDYRVPNRNRSWAAPNRDARIPIPAGTLMTIVGRHRAGRDRRPRMDLSWVMSKFDIVMVLNVLEENLSVLTAEEMREIYDKGAKDERVLLQRSTKGKAGVQYTLCNYEGDRVCTGARLREVCARRGGRGGRKNLRRAAGGGGRSILPKGGGRRGRKAKSKSAC